ncbi:MAG: hypothetical protein AB7Q17_03035 [Phycisphaerae bacterium]
MTRAIFIGLIVGVVLLGAIFVAPALFPTPEQQNRAALEQATLALRTAHGFDPDLPRLARASDPAALKQADLQKLVDSAPEAFQKLGEHLAREVAAAQQRDRAANVPAGTYAAPALTGTGVKHAAEAFDQLVGQNDALLQTAEREAAAAQQSGRDVVGVSTALGMVQYARASQLLAEAQRLRTEHGDQLARLLENASVWKLAKGDADHYAGLDTTEIRAQLAADLAELQKQEAAANADEQALAAQVAEREQEVAAVRAELTAARDELTKLEHQSFQLGDDSSFAAYRSQYQQLIDRLDGLQQREQSLAFGARTGVELDELDADAGAPADDGGETIDGLGTMQARLATATQRRAALGKARELTQAQIANLEQSGRAAAEVQQRYAAVQTEVQKRIEAVAADVQQTADAAMQKEEEAIKAAENARRAFADAETAADNWKRAAGELQQSSDPERTNPRLRMIGDDQVTRDIAASGAAQARLLLARAHVLRHAAMGEHLAVFERYRDLAAGVEFDKPALQKSIDEARENAIKALNDAVQSFEKLSKGKPESAWIPQVSLAAAYHLLARVDAGQATAHRARALELLKSATEKRDQAPYTRTAVRFREHLAAGGE